MSVLDVELRRRPRQGYTTLQKFLAGVLLGDDCWTWDGAHNGAGYAHLGDGVYVHRLSHELFVGPIPDGHAIDHLCRNRGCVRPDHLEAVTYSENNRRAWRHRARAATCRKGHPLSGENAYMHEDRRHCRACRAERARKAATARRAVA